MFDVFLVVLFVWGLVLGYYKERKEIFVRALCFFAAFLLSFGLNWPIITCSHVEHAIDSLYIDHSIKEVSTGDRTFLMVQEVAEQIPVSTQLREKIVEDINKRTYLGEGLIEVTAQVIAKTMEGLTIALIIILLMGVLSELLIKKGSTKPTGGILGAAVYGFCNLVLACVILYVMDLYFLFYQTEAIESGLLDFALKPIVQKVIDGIFKII
ncbi:hypothetical protein PRVXH_002695 [Proteinivorax hydrogeniformans]|uniref:Colicin V production protein n=1 Tax=Proteinivorax hydrogeniformans TaxID=1826727 RepID=A0AAU8HTX0_9FIRM